MVQKEHYVNLMNLLDEQTTFIFKKAGSQGYKKFSVESLETQPFGSELCIECLVGKCQVSGRQWDYVSELDSLRDR